MKSVKQMVQEEAKVALCVFAGSLLTRVLIKLVRR